MSAAFERFSPKAYAVVTRLHEKLMASYPNLQRVGPGPWTTVTFDLGPQTVTPPCSGFSDVYRWWWQAITAFGDFDPERGGQLILWDQGRVVQFPAGATVLIPPLLRYSIAAIQPGETRYSMTQYAVAPAVWSRWPAATHLYSPLAELSHLSV